MPLFYYLSIVRLSIFQGDTSLQFIMFMMKQLCSNVPSLETVKKFKLPGFVPPEKVIVDCATEYVCVLLILL